MRSLCPALWTARIDGQVGAAAAERVLEGQADLVFAGIGVLRQESGAHHQLAGDAEAALDRTVLDEGLLQRVQLALAGQALDGEHVLARRLEGGQRAGEHRRAVQQDGADAALGLVAADLGAGQAEALAQHIGQHLARSDGELTRLVVDPEAQI